MTPWPAAAPFWKPAASWGADTLDRLERIKNLSDPGDREVARRHVIQKNLDAVTQISCPRHVPANQGGMLCVHQHLIYCLLLMPDCQGRCDHFFHSTKQGTQEKTG